MKDLPLYYCLLVIVTVVVCSPFTVNALNCTATSECTIALANKYIKDCVENGTCTNGTCIYPVANENIDCNDDNVYTSNTKCNNGKCVGTCNGVYYEGECISSCPVGTVREEYTGFFQCNVPQTCTTKCMLCSSSNLCLRCEPPLSVEDGLCVTQCQLQTTVTFNPVTRTCQSVNTTPAPSTSSSPAFTTTTMAIIGGGGFLLILIIVLVLLWIRYDKKKQTNFVVDPAQQPVAHSANQSLAVDPEDVELQTLSRRTHNLDGDGGGQVESQADERRGTFSMAWGEMEESIVDTNTIAQRPKEEHKPIAAVFTSKPDTSKVSSTTAMAIDNTPTIEYDQEQLEVFFKKQRVLRRQEQALGLMLQEMQRRQEQRKDKGLETTKHNAIIADVTRALRLLKIKKSEKVLPVDAIKLMDWARATLERHLGRKAFKA